MGISFADLTEEFFTEAKDGHESDPKILKLYKILSQDNIDLVLLKAFVEPYPLLEDPSTSTGNSI